MTDRLTPGQLRDLADLIWGRDLPTPPNYLAATVQIEIAEGLRNSAARREDEYERPKPTPGVKFYCSAVPSRASCWGSNCPPDGCGYPVDERREAEERAAATVAATGPGAVATGQHPDANTPARPDAPPPSAPDYGGLIARLRYQHTENKRVATECEAADAIEALRAERDALLSEWNAMVLAIGAPKHGTAIARAAALKARAEAAEAENKRLREALGESRDMIINLTSARSSEYEGSPEAAVAFIENALAQGGNDG